ncbi:PEP-CTERM sorting domain-containing protein [Undibacterium sp.]|uniref:PEP-CTERM sorting domain-containing protein n=1 Tax=Undibacterium sp. TaxID=1914977 RepID=UPI00374D0480
MKVGTFLNKLTFSIACALCSVAAHATPAFDVAPAAVIDYDSTNYNFGLDFTVTQALTVDALAYFFDNASVTGSHAVALFDMNGNKLAQTIVDAADILQGNFRYSSITPVNLIAGATYRLVGLSNGGVYGTGSHGFSSQPGIDYLNSSYSEASGLDPVFGSDGNFGEAGNLSDSIWGASLSVIRNSAEVPEPGTYALFIAGLGLLLVIRNRKSS